MAARAPKKKASRKKASPSGIHIKPENKGTFTKYCGGKVTDKCVAKGKKSPSAAIRKKATFAGNVRKPSWGKGRKS